MPTVHVILSRQLSPNDAVEVWGPAPGELWRTVQAPAGEHPAETAMVAAERVLGEPVVWSLRRLDAQADEAWLQIHVDQDLGSGQWTPVTELLPDWPEDVQARLRANGAEG